MLNCLRINAAPSELLSGKGERYKFERAQNSTLQTPHCQNSSLNSKLYSNLRLTFTAQSAKVINVLFSDTPASLTGGLRKEETS